MSSMLVYQSRKCSTQVVWILFIISNFIYFSWSFQTLTAPTQEVSSSPGDLDYLVQVCLTLKLNLSNSDLKRKKIWNANLSLERILYYFIHQAQRTMLYLRRKNTQLSENM